MRYWLSLNSSMPASCVTELVRRSAEFISLKAKHVKLDEAALQKTANSISSETLERLTSDQAFDSELHLVGKGQLTCQYLLVLDALNFCFWPKEDAQYEDLAKGLKDAVLADPSLISAEHLACIDEAGVNCLLGVSLPLLGERARLLREVGEVLQSSYSGQASNLILQARGSAEGLVALLTTQFRGFQDHGMYRGQQVFFYKRAQIFVGDVWGAFRGQGFGFFHDIHQLTMFADYRVPVVLRELGILRYSETLCTKVQNKEELPAGSAEEAEIRACSIRAVELLRDLLRSMSDIKLHSIQLDWWLWEEGERLRKQHPPHHRTLTIYY